MNTPENRVAPYLVERTDPESLIRGAMFSTVEALGHASWASLFTMATLPQSHQMPHVIINTSLTPEEAVARLAKSIKIEELERRLEKLEQYQHVSVTAPITILPDDTLEVRRNIPAVIQIDDDDCYVATFFDANVSASGDTAQEAFLSLQDMICAQYHLYSRKRDKLSHDLMRDFSILKQFVAERT